MYKIAVFVPEDALELVKEAMFAAGGGRIGNYEACSWQTLGQGQFRPLQGSQPAIGTKGKLEQVSEYRVEMVCTGDKIKQVAEALKHAHPYEEPSYDIWKVGL
jgi:hypothetical protein